MRIKYSCYTGSNKKKYCYFEILRKTPSGKYIAVKRIPAQKQYLELVRMLVIKSLLESIINDLFAARKKFELIEFLFNASFDEIVRFTSSWESKIDA